MAIATKFQKVTDGTQLNEGYFNESVNVPIKLTLKNHVRQLIDRAGVYSADGEDLWGEAYIDANGRNNSVVIEKTSLVFDTNKYKVSSDPFVIIEATSISSESDFQINDCVILEISSGKWQLSCTTGTDEEKRAKIYQTLFQGTSARITSTYITGLTALKTSVSRDVGKRAYYRTLSFSTVNPADGSSVIDTFDDTSTNLSVSVWSSVSNNDQESSSGTYLPQGTAYNTPGVDGSANLFGTDTTTYEQDNPANHYIYGNQNSTSSGFSNSSALIMSISTMTEGTPVDINITSTSTWIDFENDHSVPVMTAVTEDFLNIIEHNIPSGTFGNNISNGILSPMIEDWEDGADIQYKLTNSSAEDSGWLTINEVNNFTAFTSEPETLIVKLIPKTTSPTAGYPSIRGVALRAE